MYMIIHVVIMLLGSIFSCGLTCYSNKMVHVRFTPRPVFTVKDGLSSVTEEQDMSLFAKQVVIDCVLKMLIALAFLIRNLTEKTLTSAGLCNNTNPQVLSPIS